MGDGGNNHGFHIYRRDSDICYREEPQKNSNEQVIIKIIRRVAPGKYMYLEKEKLRKLKILAVEDISETIKCEGGGL